MCKRYGVLRLVRVIEYLVRRCFVVTIVGRGLSRQRPEWDGMTRRPKSERPKYQCFVGEERFVSREVGAYAYSVK
jgi:hypothetical protein